MSAPDWKKNPTDETPITGDGWFDAPPFNRAVWQKAPKRLLVWFQSGSGLSTGTEKCDTAWNGSWAVWQKGTLAAENATIHHVARSARHNDARYPDRQKHEFDRGRARKDRGVMRWSSHFSFSGQ